MPRLSSFTLEIKTGERPGPETPMFNINGFPVEFDSYEGSTQASETLKVAGHPNSFPHALQLIGPEESSAPWDIEEIKATYHCANVEPYTIRLGKVTLDDESNLNIWYDPPRPAFDV